MKGHRQVVERVEAFQLAIRPHIIKQGLFIAHVAIVLQVVVRFQDWLVGEQIIYAGLVKKSVGLLINLAIESIF